MVAKKKISSCVHVSPLSVFIFAGKVSEIGVILSGTGNIAFLCQFACFPIKRVFISLTPCLSVILVMCLSGFSVGVFMFISLSFCVFLPVNTFSVFPCLPFSMVYKKSQL